MVQLGWLQCIDLDLCGCSLPVAMMVATVVRYEAVN